MSDLVDRYEAKPLKVWHEDDGPVVWWKFPVQEPPFIGSPHGSDWPGYHTHWTPLPPIPHPPTKLRRRLVSMQRKGGERVRAKLCGTMVLIWSDEHSAWWRAEGAGYTVHRSAAGAYFFEDAWRRTSHCGPEKRIIFEVLS